MKITRDIKKEIFHLKREGLSSPHIATRFEVGISTVKNLTVGIGPRSHYKVKKIPMNQLKQEYMLPLFQKDIYIKIKKVLFGSNNQKKKNSWL